MQITNGKGENLRDALGQLMRSIMPFRGAIQAFLLIALLLFPVSSSLARDLLTIGVTQFPSTLNPNIDAMVAKSYVLGLALRPFTVYDANWKLVCLLCVEVPSIEN